MRRLKSWNVVLSIMVVLLVVWGVALSQREFGRDEEGQAADIRDAEQRLDDVEPAFAELADTVAEWIAEAEPRLQAVESSVSDAAGGADAGAQVAEVQEAVDDLRDCVNEYLRAVDESGGGRYSFSFC